MEEKILDIFLKSKNYDIALMTTFNFDITFFERSILNRLYENNVKKVSLFVDSYELNKALSEISSTSIGRKYIVNPVEMKEAFHPKVILLLGQSCAKLVVSSANITVSGYLKNNEIFNIFDYNDAHPENIKLINSAIKFFEQLNERSYNQDKAIFDEIKSLVYYDKTATNEELYLLYNLDNSILSQVTEIVKDVTDIDIAVPYYDNYAYALEALHTYYPDAKINLYLQHKKSKFPLSHKNSRFISKIFAFDKCNSSNYFYHGKVFRFTTADDTFFLYGSANCTKSALVKSSNENGNIECCVLEKGVAEDFDEFFNNFELIDDTEELQCDLLTFESKDTANFFYRYGTLGTELIFNFGYSKKYETVEVFYDDIKLHCEYKNNSLVVSAPADVFLAADLITLIIKYNGKREEIKCWYTDISTLNFYRARTSDEALYTASLYNEDSEKYVEDARLILDAMSLCIDDAVKEKLLLRKFNNSKKEADEEDYDDEDGIISYVIPDASEIAQYRKHEYVDKHFKTPCFNYFRETYETHLTGDKQKHLKCLGEKTEIHKRPPKTSEQRFMHFLKSRVKQMLNPEFIEYVSFEHYIFCVNTVLGIFDRYSIKEYVTDMFEYEYLISVRLAFIEALMTKDSTSDSSEEIHNAFLILISQMMLESNKQVNKCSFDENKLLFSHRDVLKYLNSRYDFRNNMSSYICAAVDIINSYHLMYQNYAEAITEIDKMFGYETEEKLRKIIADDYGEDATVYFDYNNTIICARTDTMKDFMMVKEQTVSALKNLYYNSGNGRFLTIEIRNTVTLPPSSSLANVILEKIDFKNNSREQTITSKNGFVYKSKKSKLYNLY